jgi:hypothetical protein
MLKNGHSLHVRPAFAARGAETGEGMKLWVFGQHLQGSGELIRRSALWRTLLRFTTRERRKWLNPQL